MRFTFPCALALTLLTVLCVWPVCPATASAFELTVMHVNDTHSYLSPTKDSLVIGGKKTYVTLGGWPQLTTAIADIRASHENVALLHAGDAVQGGLYFMNYHGAPEMAFLNRLRFDAMTLGNHEFDKGADQLTNMLGLLRLPVLCANIETTDHPWLGKRLAPLTILTYGQERVGVIGLTTEETATISVGGHEVHFTDPVATAKRYVAELEAQGVNKIILLTHMGYGMDQVLAAEVPGVDLIVGGHSHTLLGDAQNMDALGKSVNGPYPTLVKNPDGDTVYITTAWKWARVLPTLDLTFDDEGRITSATGRAPLLLTDSFQRKNGDGKKVEVTGEEREHLLAALDQSPSARVVQADPDAAAFLKPYTDGLASLKTTLLGNAAMPLEHMRKPTRQQPRGSRLGPLVCKSMLWVMEKNTGRPVDIALINTGGVRDSLPEGPISVGDVLALMPFANTLYSLPVTGAQVRLALEYGVAQNSGAFPAVAGIRFEADMNAPAGKRITRVEVLQSEGKMKGQRKGRWLPLDEDRTYQLVTNAFLAHGGDGYDMLPAALGSGEDTGFVDSQVFMDFIREQQTLTAPEETGVLLTW